MADYLLDTNTISYWYNPNCPQHANVLARVSAARQPDRQTGYVSRFFVSVITLGEIEYGHRVTPNPNAAAQAAYAKFVNQQCPVPLDITKNVAQDYGAMKAWLFSNCGPKQKKSNAKRAEELVNPSTGKELGIDENDIWIAAQAAAYNLVLVTNDSRGNFGKIIAQFARTLTVENWAK
ncbi:MAG TPA: type II toxin-antitoxin system VapC family toxin [Pirellulales bacterium]